MPRKLSLSKETVVELTSDEMSAVVGGAADSDSCTCGIGNVCITKVAELIKGGS